MDVPRHIGFTPVPGIDTKRSWFVGFLTLGMLLALAAPASALDIDQVVWGFDGQVVQHRFNLLSVLVTNSQPQAFDGQVTLQKSVGGRVVDAPIVEPLYLAPHSSRWVQMFPYCKQDWEEWSLSWSPAPKGEFALTKPRPGKPGLVLLEEPDTLAVSGGALKRLPANLFPVQVTGTDGLAAAVLNHVPRWEEPRQRAFLDWLKRGGRVHILQDGKGSYPQFTGLLTELNVTADRTRLGAGIIFRHTRQLREVTTAYVEQVMQAERNPADIADQELLPKVESAAKDKTGENGILDPTQFASSIWEGDETLLKPLKKLSRPEHSWVLIHFLSLAYIALVFPGCFAVALRRGGDYRYVFGALLSVVGLFSVLFYFIGRRGYGEVTATHSVAIARALDGGRYDVSGWTNAFAVEGADYRFTHDGTGRIYSTCQDDEAVRGEIRSGAEAGLTADLPPYSSRAFGYRVVSTGPASTAAIESLETSQAIRQETITLRDFRTVSTPSRPERILERLVITKGAEFPSAYRQLYALYGRHLYLLSENGERLVLRSEIGSLTSYLKIDPNSLLGPFASAWDERDGTKDQIFSSLFAPLLARSLDFDDQKEVFDFELPEDRVRLFVYAEIPESLSLKTSGFPTQLGYVLYCYDVFLSPNP